MTYVRRKPRYAKKKPVSFAKRVRKVISAAAQLKHATNSPSIPTMVHDTMYFTSPTQNIAQGTAINQRIGDQVKLKSLKINGVFIAASLSNATVKYRFAVFYCPEGNSAPSVTASLFSGAYLFHPNSFATNTYGQFDEKAVTVLADLTVDLNSNISTAKDIKSFAFSIPLKNVPAKFRDSGSTFAMKKNLYIMAVGYTSNAANVADVGALTYSYNLEFQDI